MSENNNNEEQKPPLENTEGKLSEGFRLVEEGEVIPGGQYETRMDLTLQKSITNAPKKEKPPFPEPKVLEAKVDPKQQPEQPKTKFSFSNPSTIHQQNAQQTKGDAQAPEKKNDNLSADERLKKLDEAIKRDEGTDKTYTYDDYADTGEMFVEGWEGILQFAAGLISKDSSQSAYGFTEDKKKKLIYQATKVSRKRNWVVPIEISFLGNLIPASTGIIMKARNSRKEYMKKKQLEEKEDTPVEIVKGGPNKGEIKTRGPGRPRK